MRKLQLTALLLCAAMALPAAGCGSKSSSSDSSETVAERIANGGDEPGEAPTNVYQNDSDHYGVNEEVVDMNQEADQNDTMFTLNKVYSITPEGNDSEKYIYFDVTIKNNTDKAYTLNILNNFYLIYPDGNEKYGDIKTELYANSHFNSFNPSPFEIPANGELSGIVGGFAVSPQVEEFTVGFFPTQEDINNKENVIKVNVSADEIIADPDDILK